MCTELSETTYQMSEEETEYYDEESNKDAGGGERTLNRTVLETFVFCAI